MESEVKGAIYLLKDSSILDQGSANFARFERYFDFATNLMLSEAIKIPTMTDLISGFLSTITLNVRNGTMDHSQVSKVCEHFKLRYAPIPQTNLDMKTIKEKYMRKYLDRQCGWKLRIYLVILMSILSESLSDKPGTDDDLMESLCETFLEFMNSEIASVRSLAVNRGVDILHRLYQKRSGLYPLIDLDQCHSVHTFKPAGHNLDIKSFFTTFIHWATMDMNGNELSLNLGFRMDCAELYQTLAELSGTEIVAIVEGAMEEVENKSPLAYQRAACEILTGISRGLGLLGWMTEEVVDKLSLMIIKEVLNASIDVGKVWNESMRWAFDSVSRPNQLFHLLDRLECSLIDGINQSTSFKCVMIQLLTGVYRSVMIEAISPRMLSLLEGYLSDSYDSIRRNTAHILATMASKHFIDFANILKLDPSRPEGSKGLLVLVERMVLTPLKGRFWKLYPDILNVLIQMSTIADKELQAETRRVLKVMAWTSSAPSDSIDIIGRLFEILQNTGTTYQGRSRALEWLQIFYTRNYNALGQDARKIIEETMKYVTDKDLDVRMEASNVLKLIFHTQPVLSAEYKVVFEAKLRGELDKIKDPSGTAERHGAVLSAGSLILSHPYRLPSWIPGLLSLLARFINDRNPIGTSARKTFSEFRRTHSDTWEIDREQFSVEQLDAINELSIAPSYYA